MNLMPVEAEVDIVTDFSETNPQSKIINVPDEGNTLSFDLVFENAGTYFVIINFDFKEAVYYKVIVAE